MKKKNLLILSLTAMMGLGLVACNVQDGSSAPASSDPAPESSAPAPESSAPAPTSSETPASSSAAPASSSAAPASSSAAPASSSAAPASSSAETPASSSEEPTGGETTVTIESIAVDSADAKTTYEAGETFSAEGIKVTATMSDGTTAEYGAADCAVVVKDASGATVTSLEEAGSYKVIVTKDGVSASYDIKVNPILRTFAQAMKLGAKNHDKVQSGTVVTNYDNFGLKYTENCSYSYGENVSVIKDASGSFYVTEYDGEALTFRDKDYDGESVPFERLRTDYYREATGLNFYFLFYNNFDFAFYGVEDMITGIYDLYDTYGVGERTVTEATYENPNTYSYHMALDVYDSIYHGKVWDVTVTFDLDANDIFNNVTVKTKRYSSASVIRDEIGDFVEFASTTEFELNATSKIEQVAGPQNAVFDYDLDEKFAQSYKIVDQAGNEYNGTDTYTFDKGTQLFLKFSDVSPAGVNFTLVDFVDVSVDDGDAIYVGNYGFSLDYMADGIPVSLREVGTHTIRIRTWNVTTTIHLKIERPIIPVAESEYYAKWKAITDDSKAFNIDKDGIHYGGKTYLIKESTDQWVKGETADGEKITFLVETGDSTLLIDENGVKYEIDRSVTKIDYSEWYGYYGVQTQNGVKQSGWYCNVFDDAIHFMGADGVDHIYNVTKKESNKLYASSEDPAVEVGADMTIWKMSASMIFLLGTNYQITFSKEYVPAGGIETPEEPEEPAKTIADYYGCYVDTNNNPLVVSKDGLVLAGKVYPLKGLNDDGSSIIYDSGDWLNPDGMIFIQADGTLKGLFPYNKAFKKVCDVPEGAMLDFSEYYGTYKTDDGRSLTVDSAGVTDDMGTAPIFYATASGIMIYDSMFSAASLLPYNAETKTLEYFGEYVKEEATAGGEEGGETTGPTWASFYGTYVGDDGSFEINETQIIWNYGATSTIDSYQDGVLVARGMFGDERYTLQADGISFEYGGHVYTNQNPTTGGEDAGGSDSSAEPWKAYVGAWQGNRGTSITITADGKVDLGWMQMTILSSTSSQIVCDNGWGGQDILTLSGDTFEYFGETFTRA